LRVLLVLGPALSWPVAAAPEAQGELAPASLLVSVRYGGESTTAMTGSKGRHYQTADRNPPRQLRMLEGHTAYLSYGEAIPYPTISVGPDVVLDDTRYGIEYRELQSSFTVTPRLQGDQVLLEIEVANERRSRQDGGIIDNSALSTVVSGAIGEWIRLAGSAPQEPAGASGKVISTAPKAREAESEVWVRVERLD
jgi:hypothetical protein